MHFQMKHRDNYYVKFDDDELRQILKEISNEEVKERIRSALGETIDPNVELIESKLFV